MGTHLWFWSVWLVLLYGASTTVTGAASCKQECPSSSSSVFHYQDGHKYIYNLEGTSTTTLPGAQNDVSKLQVKATVELSVESACSHLIKLKDVQIVGAGEKKYSSLKFLEQHPALANFQGGVINSQLCTEAEDNKPALNLKRAVLSLLQVSASAGSGSSFAREVDIFGICPTEITSSKEGDVVTVKKTRNLNRCSHRENLKQEILSTPFVGNADLQSTPILESTYTSEQHIKKGVISNALSHETYLFRPFSKLGSGAKTIVETKLTLVSHKPGATPAPAAVNFPRSIIFEAPQLQDAVVASKASILDALRAALDATKVSVQADGASKFRTLVHVLRLSTKEDILSAYGDVKAGAGVSDKVAARKILLDAIFKTGTGDSVVAAVELLKSHEIEGDLSKLWYIAIGYARQASASSLSAVSSLLDDAAHLPREGILAAGSLAGRYCREHNCANVAELNDLTGKLIKLIKPNVKSLQDENRAIIALKSLGNIHHLTGPAQEKLIQVASEKSIPPRVRVAALEAYQSDACHATLKKSALDILSDTLEDSEIRIKAYLSLIECPSGALANSLKELLEKEPTNQVGSYIVSHLRNLRSSTNPAKAEAKEHFRSLRPRKHFREDFRKFSSNFEVSYILDGLNIGNSLESNVIYSENSFVPRSVNLNLTTEIFGHSYNVLELSAREENVDRILESYFGPRGYFNSHSLVNIVQTIKKAVEDYSTKVRENVEHTVRQKRSIGQSDLDRIKNEVIKSLPATSKTKELILDLSLKLFGSELAWINLGQETQDISINAITDKVFEWLNGAIDKAKNFKHEIRQHWTFLDSELTYPTGLGFPLKLAASGSTAVHLHLGGQIDIPALLKQASSSAFELDVRPSAAIEIFGTLSVDSPVEDSGLKVTYALHTDTGINVAVKCLDNKGVDVKVGLPVKKQDIFTVKTDVLKVIHEYGHPEVETQVEFNLNRKEYNGCFDQVSPVIGLTLCTSVIIPSDAPGKPSAYYPLNGRSLFSLWLESDDVTSYHFRAAVVKHDENQYIAEVLLETPGSKVDRKLELSIEGYRSPNWDIKIGFKSPWKVLVLQGTLINTNKEASLAVKFLNDGSEYSAKLGAKVSGDSSHATYTPLLEYKSPDQKERQVAKGRKTSSRIQQGYHVKGNVVVDGDSSRKKITFNKVSFNTPHGDLEISGTIEGAHGLFQSDVIVVYGANKVALKSKVQKLGANHYLITAVVIPTKQKELSAGLKWEFQYGDELRNELVISHGEDLNSDDNRLTLSQQFRYVFQSVKNFDFFTKNRLTYPFLGINAKIDANAKPKNINYDVLLQYESYKVGSELHLKRGIAHEGDHDLVFVVQILNNGLKVGSNLQVVGDDHFKLSSVLDLKKIVKYELNADVKNKIEENNVNVQVVASLNVDDKPKQYELDTGIIANPSVLNTHAKLKVASVSYLDTVVVINKVDGSGNAKVILKDYLDGSSTFNYNKNGGKVTLEINLPKISRKVRGNADLTITGSVHQGNLELLWNADHDPNQKLVLRTTTDLKPDSIDSKNTIHILDYKTVLNLKGALTGEVNDGHLIANGDLILPNGRQFTVKYDETLHIRPNDSDGRVEIVLLDTPKKGSHPRRLSVEAAARDVNTKLGLFIASGKLEFTSTEGKNIKFVINGENIEEGQYNVVKAEAHVEGSLIPQPIKLSFDSKISRAVITYKSSGHYGNDVSANVDGTLHVGLDDTSPKQLDNVVEIKIPNDALKHVKLSTSVKIQISPEKKLELVAGNELTWNEDQVLKLDGEVSGDVEHGAGKIIVLLPKGKPVSLGVGWSNPDDKGSGLKKGGSLALEWDSDKHLNIAGDLEVPKDGKSYKLKLTAATPNEHLKKLDLALFSKELENPARHVQTEAILLLNDKKITLDSKIGLAPGVPAIDITVVQPIGKSKLYLNIDKFTSDELKLQTEVLWAAYGGGSLTSDGELKLSLDDFKLLWNVDSPKLNINKWHVDAGHRAVKSTKKIFFTVKAADKPVLSGSTTLRTKTDDNTVTYDGVGAVNVEDKTQSFNFRIERVKLLQDANGETGIQYKGNAKVGSKVVDGIFKITNKEFHIFNKYCKKADDCALVEAKSLLNVADVTELDHELALLVDLKTLDISHGIDLKSKTVRHGEDVDQGIDLQLFSKGRATKYSYKLLIGDDESALTIALPQRVIALEVTTKGDVEDKKGKIKLGFILWWDKYKKPASRTEGSLVLTHDAKDNEIYLTSEAKFNNPSLERELVIKGKTKLSTGDVVLDSTLDLDVFKKENQKITVLLLVKGWDVKNGYRGESKLDIKSKGQNIDIVLKENELVTLGEIEYDTSINYKVGKHPKKEAELKFELSQSKQKFLVKIPDQEIISLDGSTNHIEITVLGSDTVVVQTDVKNHGQTFKTIIHRKNSPDKKLTVSGGIDNGVALRAQKISGGDAKDLFHVSVSTKEDDFLKTDFGWSTENIRKLINEVIEDSNKLLQKVKKVLTEYVEQVKDDLVILLDALRKNQPNFKRLLEVGEQQLKLIRKEIENDAVLHEISENIKKVFGNVAEILEDTIKGISNTLDALYANILEIEDKLIEAIKRAAPQVSEAWKKFVESLVAVTAELLEELGKLLNELGKVVQAHEEEIKRYLGLVRDFLQDIGKIVTVNLRKFTAEINDFSKLVIEELKSLKIYEVLKERYDEVVNSLPNLELPETVWTSVRDVLAQVKEGLPTDELRDLVTEIEKYIEKLIRKEKVETDKEVDRIYNKLVQAIKSVIAILKGYAQETEDTDVALLGQQVPFTLKSFLQLPRLLAIRLSPLSYITSEQLPDLLELYYTYRPTLEPLDWIPPFTGHAILVNSNDFITFDHRHYKLQGSCSYVLAQDYHDGNFSIVANFGGSRLKSIEITDGKDTVEILDDKSIKVNGAPSEYPVHQGQFVAWWQVGSVNIKALSGVWIHFLANADAILFDVSGYYFAKTRGLLGTINYEPWDDFTVPNGHVASKANEFGNAWKLNPGCPDAPEESSPSDTPVAECSEIFAGSTELRLCFPFIKPRLFRDSCSAAARGASSPEEKKKIACNFAAAYAEACKAETPVITIPPSCAHCSAIGGSSFGIGEVVALKVPQRSADVILLVEQALDNGEIFKELVTSLVPTLTNDLKSKGINDVKFILIGYGAPEQKWPNYYTIDGQPGFGGQKITFHKYEPVEKISVQSFETALQFLKQEIQIEIRKARGVEAFVEATKYPFRVGAVKTIVSVVGSPCEKTSLLSPVYLTFAGKLYNELGISAHLITPVEGIHTKDEKSAKQLVGFDSETTYSFSDAKRKFLDGDAELRKTLEYSHTVCTDGAQKTHGAVFNTNNYLGGNQQQRKQFLQVVSHRIAESLTGSELTQDCTCLIVDGVNPSPLCRVKSRREKEHTKTKNVKG